MLTTQNPPSETFTNPSFFPMHKCPKQPTKSTPQEPAAGTTVGLLALRTPLKAMTNFPSSNSSAGDVKLSMKGLMCGVDDISDLIIFYMWMAQKEYQATCKSSQFYVVLDHPIWKASNFESYIQ